MAGVLEGLSAEKTISAFYIAYFGRPADPQGFSYWLSDFARGQSLTQIANNFAPQGETSEEYPFLVNDADGDGTFEVAPVSDTAFFRAGLRDVISDIYVNLFGREPTAAELAEGGGVDYWVDEILVRGQPLGEIAIRIANGASPTDAAVLTNKIDVAESFTLAASEAGIGDQASEVTPEFKAAAAAIIASVDETEESVTAALEDIEEFVAGGVPGGALTLTDDIGENIVGTAANETINVVIGGDDATLNIFDSINGGGGTDTLNALVDGDGELPASASITGVEIINLNQTEALLDDGGADGIDAETFEGATQIWQIGAAQSLLNVAAAQTAGFRDAAVDAGVEFNDATGSIVLDNVDTDAAILVAGDDLVTVNVSGTVAADEDLAGEEIAGTLTLGSSADVETLNLSLTSDTNVVLFAEETVDAGEDGEIGTDDDVVTTSLDALTTVDASDSTGDLTITASAAVETLIGGSGDDTLIEGADGASVTGGAGADRIELDDTEASEVVFAEGDTGLTAATIDVITGFTVGEDGDTLNFGLAEATEDNFLDAGFEDSFVGALTNANTAFDGTLQYVVFDTNEDAVLFVDRDLDGTADEAVNLVGVVEGELTIANITGTAVA